MRRALAMSAVMLAGCGRLGFGAARDGATDGVGDAPAARDVPIDASQVFGNRQPVANVNSPEREFGPSISNDGLELYFTSNRNGSYLIYVTTRATIGDDFATPVLAQFNGATYDGEAGLARDGVEMTLGAQAYVTRTDAQAPWSAPGVAAGLVAGYEGNDFGGGDLRMAMFGATDNELYEASRATLTSPWSALVALSEVAPMPENNYPTMTDDGLEILFQSCDATDTQCAVYHAYRSAIDEPFGPSSPALDLPAGVSTGDPGVSGDGHTLYYSSGEGTTAGSSDLWVATRP